LKSKRKIKFESTYDSQTEFKLHSLIEWTRFFPLGKRPVDGGNADAGYTMVPFDSYLRQANGQRFIVLQIEDPEPLDDLDAIASLEGFDMLFFGPGDFSQSIGAPGDFNHPRLIAARKRVAEVANAHGKFAGTTGHPGNLEELLAMGYHFVNIGADVIGLKNYCQDLAAAFDKTSERTKGTSYLEN
jgi:4-hydroxy-2-oxoheptanedioate aldolase